MSTRTNPMPENITFTIDGKISVLDEQYIAQALGIPLYAGGRRI